jgi:hypothetical protein
VVSVYKLQANVAGSARILQQLQPPDYLVEGWLKRLGDPYMAVNPFFTHHRPTNVLAAAIAAKVTALVIVVAFEPTSTIPVSTPKVVGSVQASRLSSTYMSHQAYLPSSTPLKIDLR